jgi:hypothetical protein
MIASAPTDFWEMVARLVAKAIIDREYGMPSTTAASKVYPLREQPPPTKEGA